MGRRLLIVDDNPRFRRLARRLLEGEGYEVVGAVETAHEALVATRKLSPEVLLLDVSLPDGSGFDVAVAIALECPEVAVLLTSTHGRGDFEQLAESCGARGFVPKDELSGREVTRLLC
jgi:DNA-binding NarL/FixJ family response regulator